MFIYIAQHAMFTSILLLAEQRRYFSRLERDRVRPRRTTCRTIRRPIGRTIGRQRRQAL